VEDDGSNVPYNVRAESGKTWWYRREAIVKAEVCLQMQASCVSVLEHILDPLAVDVLICMDVKHC
jgi:hypothetical protein